MYLISGILLFGKVVLKLRRTFFMFDTVGIAVFTVLGLQKALNLGVHPVIAIMMGMVSAVFGGVIRDIVCNEIPLIFRKEIYATACILGGLSYFIINKLPIENNYVFIIAGLVVIMIRLVAVKFKVRLPSLYK